MLQERIRQHQQAALLEQTIAAMPEYPIYQVSPGQYIIYVAGQRHVFDTEAGARMCQLAARAQWLRAAECEEKRSGCSQPQTLKAVHVGSEGRDPVVWIDELRNATETHNSAGCPYLNQTGHDAVQDWAKILASIDPTILAADLQTELQQLRVRSLDADMLASNKWARRARVYE